MAPKTKREQELEIQMAEMRAQLQLLTSLATAARPTTTTSAKPVVGIRNVSSYTIGLHNPLPGEEEELQLHPSHFGEDNPNARLIVSEQYWQLLRRGKEVRNGMIIRDDSFVTSSNVAPVDNETDLPPEFAKNVVIDPMQWIESRTDEELVRDINAMTSEPSLRRLQAAVTRKIWEIGEEKYKDDDLRGKKALRDLPGIYHRAESIVLERLDEFRPNHKNYRNERETNARLA